ncbi:MAG: glycosyltransferase [Asticcacaulis sp.]
MYKDSREERTPIKRLFLQRPVREAKQAVAPLAGTFSARSGPSWQQIAAIAALAAGGGLTAWLAPDVLSAVVYWLCWGVFMGNAVMRLAASFIPVRPPATTEAMASNENMPFYTVIVALYKEADIVPQVLAAMLRLAYPRDRIEILFALEADDRATLDAIHVQDLPPEVHIIEVPEGTPRTKPRALNHALGLSVGDLIVIYDAEDQPHPEQLLAAANAFQNGDKALACVQAPLRPVGASSFIGRQFAAEYAVQFDVLLPAFQPPRPALPARWHQQPFQERGAENHRRMGRS